MGFQEFRDHIAPGKPRRVERAEYEPHFFRLLRRFCVIADPPGTVIFRENPFTIFVPDLGLAMLTDVNRALFRDPDPLRPTEIPLIIKFDLFESKRLKLATGRAGHIILIDHVTTLDLLRNIPLCERRTRNINNLSDIPKSFSPLFRK